MELPKYNDNDSNDDSIHNENPISISFRNNILDQCND